MGELRGTHVPVLLERCLELLAPALDRPGSTVHVDATLGLAGHAEAVLEAHPRTTLIGLDRDTEALAHARARLARFADRVHLVHAVYDELPEVLDRLGVPAVDGILFDLGVSSLQLDEPDRGFAYARDAPLDMRMDQTRGTTAEEVVNTYSHPDLARVLRTYGEERFAGRIASAIIRERQRARITSTARLAELVQEAIPAPARRTGGHPAKRTFQALRIEVNKELAALETALPAALDALTVGGRMVVLSYQSLEDRLTKAALAERTRRQGPVDLPVELPGTGPTFRLLSRGAELPGETEVTANPRAASVRLRAAERIDPDAERPGGAERERYRRRVRAMHQGVGLPKGSTVDLRVAPDDGTTTDDEEGEGS
ncbi:16S rRNA (cytosine(1402)-N(4))-methyltransferase [Micromonospora echinospora]|uniref:Ribosomal RNA small subunit methyltransferase H n=1 Tax=Micromonospora echinospora TaxID=1877 RepID=A0A1C4YEK4_MICEC|nr:16S rRNA (cytosine(1402)-N(4))-methyltransferase RsmH [Micromonospora echinospora]OZV84818.1 16S rRNA (cytosine(1402)-N(4))-methyltransferase [Micromonospora echinospora]SCF19056.1 16S rRNA (cytosine1402-N4)-methyltransferase [Micromonospora echinospora]